MLIRSQDKMSIVCVENTGQIYIDDSFSHKKKIVCADFSDGRTAKLGEYENVDKAIEVLDNICNTYQYLNECKYIGIGAAQPEFIYQME